MSILKRLFTFAMVVFLLAASGAGAQEPDVPPPIAVTLTAEQARILEGIRANDSRAIRDAGLSRDRIYLEALAGALPRRQNIPGDYMVQEALAQLGDTRQLQAIWCASTAERNYRSFNITSSLARIGGWFAIRGFDYLMSPEGDKNWMAALRYQEKNTDAVQVSPKFYIVRTLPKLIPNSVRTPEFGTGSEHVLADKWRSWIAEHREELSVLQPTGEGVGYSPAACKDGKPRDRSGR
jgi:hypothetical protein